MRRVIWLILPLLAALAVMPASAQAPRVKVHLVVVRDKGFRPEKITIRRGDKVLWRWRSDRTHSVLFRDGRYSGGKTWGDEWIRSFRRRGSFVYYCTLHRGMQGVVYVR